MSRKGFTLMELLAVIVILAVIGLITIPLFNNIINNSKSETREISAGFYVDAVEKTVLSKDAIGTPVHDGIYTVINNGNVCFGSYVNGICSGNILEIELNKNKPTSGTIKIKNGKVVKFTNLKFDNFFANMGYDLVIEITKGEQDTSICKAVTDTTKTTGTVPTGSYLVGDEYICSVNDTSSYHFFVLNTDENNVSLIMDRNIKSNGTPVTSSDSVVAYAWASVYDLMNMGLSKTDAIGPCMSFNMDNDQICYGNATKGPITAVSELNTATSTWTNIPNLNLVYTDSIYGEFTFTGKARLPYYSEILATSCEYTKASTCPLWLVNYLATNESVTGTGLVNIPGSLGYHIATSLSDVSGYYVSSNGSLAFRYISSLTGLRPVIVLDKTDLS